MTSLDISCWLLFVPFDIIQSIEIGVNRTAPDNRPHACKGIYCARVKYVDNFKHD